MFTSPDPKSPLFDMVAGIVNAHAALVRAQPTEPRITRIEFAPGHENERLTDEGVAGKLRVMKAAPVLRDALNAAIRFMRENCSDAPGYDAVYEQACAAIDQSTGATE